MVEQETGGLEAVLKRIRSQAASGAFRVTQHAQQEMAEEDIRLDDVLEAIAGG
jgi:hypothetical protein